MTKTKFRSAVYIYSAFCTLHFLRLWRSTGERGGCKCSAHRRGLLQLLCRSYAGGAERRHGCGAGRKWWRPHSSRGRNVQRRRIYLQRLRYQLRHDKRRHILFCFEQLRHYNLHFKYYTTIKQKPQSLCIGIAVYVCLKRDKRCINRGKNEEKVNCFIQTAPNAFLPKILKKVPHYCRARVNPFHKTGKLFRYEEIN